MKIALINEKGGTGKTTLAIHLAAWLAEKNKQKTLLVDMDPQGQVGKALGINRGDTKTTSALFQETHIEIKKLCQPTTIANLDVIVADKSLSHVAYEQETKNKTFNVLANCFKKNHGYDVVVFDSPPTLGFLTQNILHAVDYVVIPVGLTYLALDGCAEMVQSIHAIQQKSKQKKPNIIAIVPTFHRRTRLAEEIFAKLKHYFPDAISQPIGFFVAIDEAQSYGQTIWQYQPKSKAATRLQQVCKFISKRIGL